MALLSVQDVFFFKYKETCLDGKYIHVCKVSFFFKIKLICIFVGVSSFVARTRAQGL